ncbi:MAG: hypothetical protein L3J35_01035 [Bacteroidales bacterium]|nr:hypothetical protein [Bacteroidales bacterium]
MKKTVIIILLTLITSWGFSQERTFFASDRFSFWVPTSFSGELSTFGHYRTQKILRNYLSETQNSSRFSVGALVRSKSYFWHPNLLKLDIEAEFNPDFIKEDFIVIPDQAETRTMKRLNIKTNIFSQKPVSLLTHADFSQTYSNRENLTNIKTNRKNWGAVLRFANKVVPLNFSYNHTKWNQEETEIGRMSDMNQLNFTGRASKTFYNNDKHDLVYSHDKFIFNNYNIFQSETFSDKITLNDNFYFDQKQNYSFRSRIAAHNQKGTINFNSFNVNESLLLKLPYQFIFQSNYNFNRITQELQELQEPHENRTNIINGSLGHKLFLSLNTSIFYEYRNTINTVFDESDQYFGGNIYYTKKIPLKGRLNLSYNYRRDKRINNSDPVTLQIINENHILTDGEITLLDRPFINRATIVVKDINGAIIYQEDLDYTIIERNNYIEIQRFPGGQIANGDAVLVDYIVNQPETYSYDANFNKFSASISVLKRMFEVYFKVNNQNFINLTDADLLSLNYYVQYKYGFRFDINYVTAGVEKDNYNSTIIPYEMIRFYATANKTINDRVILSLNANYRDYYLVYDSINHIYADISGKATYRIFDLTKASLNLGYRKQVGNGINLDLLTARFEVTSKIRQLYLTFGLEKYNRDFLGQINNYNGVYFRLIRKF